MNSDIQWRKSSPKELIRQKDHFTKVRTTQDLILCWEWGHVLYCDKQPQVYRRLEGIFLQLPDQCMQGLCKVISLWVSEGTEDWNRMDFHLCSALLHWFCGNSYIIHSLGSYSKFSYLCGCKHCTENTNIVVNSAFFSPESRDKYPGIWIAIRNECQGYMGISLWEQISPLRTAEYPFSILLCLVKCSYPACERNGDSTADAMERRLLAAQRKPCQDSSSLSDIVKVRK